MVTPPTFIYCRIYAELIVGEVPIYHYYIGITNNIIRRMKEHEKGTCRTTNRFNKSYEYVSTKYKIIKNLNYEKTFKKYNSKKKLKMIKKWSRWVGW